MQTPFSKQLKLRSLTSLIGVAGLCTLLQQPATAAQFHQGWNYAFDAVNDSLALRPDNTRQAGGTIYEIGGLAFKDDVDTDSLWFAISGNLPIYGDNIGATQLCPAGDSRCYPVPDANIGWGDLVLDFSGLGNLKAASDARQLYAIRFSPTNDSGAPFLGVYRDVQLASVGPENAGYPTLANNNNMLRILTGGRTASMGDLAWNDPYYNPYTTSVPFNNTANHMPNVIGSGTKVAEVTLLGRSDLEKAGLDSSFLPSGTNNIFGFRIPKSVLQAGQFVATLLTECINDGIALVSQLVATPPPPPVSQICPVLDGQRNALLPTRIENGVKIFENVPSGLWYDPDPTMGFIFETVGNSLFTAINGFPCAVISPQNPSGQQVPFNVLVENQDGEYQFIGDYYAGQTELNFEQIYGTGVSKFLITGIDPNAWIPWLTDGPQNPLAFELDFDQSVVSFNLTRVDDLTTLRIKPRVGPPLEPPCFEKDQCIKVPEPSMLFGLGMVTIGLFHQQRRRKIQSKS